MCNNFLLALLDQHFNTVGRFPALATLCRLSKTEKRKEPYKEEWGGKGIKEEQSEGLLTSSGDCARASSACKDPKLLWFNL